MPGSTKFDKETRENIPCQVYSITGLCANPYKCQAEHPEFNSPSTLFIKNAFSTVSSAADFDYLSSSLRGVYSEFFEDFLQELRKIGFVKVFKTTINNHTNLRGSVFAEFLNNEDASAALQKFDNRLYNGTNLKCSLISVKDWKKATCGKNLKGTCQGKNCPYFHFYPNPENEFKFQFENLYEVPKPNFVSKKIKGDVQTKNNSNMHNFIVGDYSNNFSTNRYQPKLRSMNSFNNNSYPHYKKFGAANQNYNSYQNRNNYNNYDRNEVYGNTYQRVDNRYNYQREGNLEYGNNNENYNGYNNYNRYGNPANYNSYNRGSRFDGYGRNNFRRGG